MLSLFRSVFLLFSLLVLFSADVHAEGRYNIGWIYKSFMVVYKDGSGDPLYRIPIPAGDWKLISESVDREQTGRRVQRLMLARLSGNHVSFLLEIRASVENNHSRRWEEEPCRKDSIFENNYGTSLWTQRCLAISARPVVRFSADDAGRRAIGFLSSNSLTLPRNPVQITSTQFGDRGKFLSVSLTLFPGNYGFAEASAAETADHPWGHQVAMLDPARKHFLDRLKVYAENFGTLVFRAYRDEDMTAFVISDFELTPDGQKVTATAPAGAPPVPAPAAVSASSPVTAQGQRVVPALTAPAPVNLPVAPSVAAAGSPASAVASFRYEAFGATAPSVDSVQGPMAVGQVARVPASAGTSAAPAFRSGNRRALLLGNNQYRFVSPLANARADATSLAAALNEFSYQTTLKLDVDTIGFKAALRAFKNSVEPGDEVLIYYAGHGVQIGSTNFLLPVDVGGESEEQIRDEAIPLQRILDDMAERKAKLTLAIVDACRDNPFQGSGRTIGSTRGLAPTSAATGQMVVYAAGTGQKSLDRLGPTDPNRNGLFTRVLLREMQRKELSVDRVIKLVRQEVADVAKRYGFEQVPAIYDQVLGDFFFSR